MRPAELSRSVFPSQSLCSMRDCIEGYILWLQATLATRREPPDIESRKAKHTTLGTFSAGRHRAAGNSSHSPFHPLFRRPVSPLCFRGLYQSIITAKSVPHLCTNLKLSNLDFDFAKDDHFGKVNIRGRN